MKNFATALGVVLLLAAPVSAHKDKVLVCHAAGQEGTTHYVTLEVPPNEGGYPQGHFTENGTQKAGHEEDYLGACQEPSPSPSPSVEPSPSPSASIEPSPEPSPSTTTPNPSPRTPESPPPTDTSQTVADDSGAARTMGLLLLLVSSVALAYSYISALRRR